MTACPNQERIGSMEAIVPLKWSCNENIYKYNKCIGNKNKQRICNEFAARLHQQNKTPIESECIDAMCINCIGNGFGAAVSGSNINSNSTEDDDKQQQPQTK